MNNQFLLGAIAASTVVVGGAMFAPSAQAFSLTATSLDTSNTFGYDDTLGGLLDISLTVNANNTATFQLTNNAPTSGTNSGLKVSDMWFGVSGVNGFTKYFEFSNTQLNDLAANNGYVVDYCTTGVCSYDLDYGGSPNGSSFTTNYWSVLFTADAAGGSDAGTVGAGETFAATFSLKKKDATNYWTEADLLNAFLSDPEGLGFAFHLQGIPNVNGNATSEKYIALPTPDPVPTPAAVLPVLGGLFGLARRKKEEASA